ncbi:MAG: hypothetical protein WKF80_05495 [Thermomicrobiales bacterium]
MRTRLLVIDQIVTPFGTDWVGGVEEWWGVVLDRLPWTLAATATT